jgi:hypothetical protein
MLILPFLMGGIRIEYEENKQKFGATVTENEMEEFAKWISGMESVRI